MDASALLSKQGWRGSGFSLDQTNRGLAKPLLVARKVDALGLGTKKDDFTNQWWLKAWDTPAPTQAPTPPSEPATHGITSRISGTGGLYSHFIKADTLGGTLDERLKASLKGKAQDTMTDTSNAAETKQAKKDGKKRKRDSDPSAADSTEAKKSKKSRKDKKDKTEKKSKKDQVARDLTPPAEDTEDIFFVDTTGSATKPVSEPTKGPTKRTTVLSKKDRKAVMAEKRSKKLAEKQDRVAAASAGGKKAEKAKQTNGNHSDSSSDQETNDVVAPASEAVKMDTGADFVALGDEQTDAVEMANTSKGLSGRKVTRGPKVPRSTLKFQARKAKREGLTAGVTYNDSTDPTSTRGKTKKKKAFMRTPEEKAAAEALHPKVNKAEKYLRQKALREAKRARKAQSMTPEKLAAEEAEKKEMKRLKKEKDAKKAADKEAKALSRNQRKAAKKAAKAQWRASRAARVAETV